MTFKIPSPWNPGYAIPGYVKAEGLQTRAFVTKWAPRGTYDDPSVANPTLDSGYAVPQYIRDEGYGQGAYVTEWASRGSYVGSVKRCARRMKQNQAALGDASLPGPFQAYGRTAAAAILVKVRGLPVEQRKRALTAVLDAIDPSLYRRAEAFARQYQNSGVAPAAAVELGLARAMGQGIADEIVDVGKKGRRPAAKGQLGLGCYGVTRPQGMMAGLAGLGATFLSKVSSTSTAPTTTAPTTSTTTSSSVPPKPGQCSADGLYIWKIAADGSGYWARRSPTDTCSSTYTGAGPTTGGTAGGVTVTDTKTGEVAPVVTGIPAGTAGELAALTWMEVGPFRVPLDAKSFTIRWGAPLPDAWQAFIVPQIAKDADVDATPGHIYGRLRQFIPGLPARINHNFVLIEDPALITRDTKTAPDSSRIPSQPIVIVKRPDNNQKWGVYMVIDRRDVTKPWDSTTNPYILVLKWVKEPTGYWDWIKTIFAAIVGNALDTAKDILETVSDVACNLLQSQGAAAAGGAAAASQGVPPQVGAQGVQIAATSCGTPPPPPGEEGGSGEWILPVAIGGGVILAAMLLLPKKRKKA